MNKARSPQQGGDCAELLEGKLASTWARGFVCLWSLLPPPSPPLPASLSDEKQGYAQIRGPAERAGYITEICFIRFSLATEKLSKGERRGLHALGSGFISDYRHHSTSDGKDEMRGRTGRGGLPCSHSQLREEAVIFVESCILVSLPRGEEERDGEPERETEKGRKGEGGKKQTEKKQ